MVVGSLPKARTEMESRITPRRNRQNRLRVELREGHEDVVTMELDFELEFVGPVCALGRDRGIRDYRQDGGEHSLL